MSLTKATYTMVKGSPVNVLDFGATGDGVTDDWEAIQRAICHCNTNNLALYVPAGTYAHSKTLFLNCSDFALAQTSVNGENVLSGGVTNNVYTVIKGAGVENTTFLYTGSQHALQVGEFSNTTYGDATKATWHADYADFSVTCSGAAKKGIAGSWIHFMKFRNIYVNTVFSDPSIGFLEHNWFISRGFASFERPSLWNTFYDIQGKTYSNVSGVINFYLHGNSNTVKGFFAGASDVCIEARGTRNVYHISCENTDTSGLSNAFVRTQGLNTFTSPDLETGANGVADGFILVSGYTVITQPIVVGITGDVLNVTPGAEYLVYPQLVAGSANLELGRTQIRTASAIAGQFSPYWKTRAIETTSIPIGTSPTWGASTFLVDAGPSGDPFGGGLVFHGIILSNCTQASTEVNIGADTNDPVAFTWAPISITLNPGDVLYLTDKDFEFFFGQLNKTIRVIRVRARAGSSGTFDAKIMTLEANNLFT